MPKRPYKNHDGTISMVDLPECKCSPSERRGPAGGVCWCGGAIPHETQSILKTLNKETISFVLLNDTNLPAEVINEIIEIIWRSDSRLEEIQLSRLPRGGK